MGDATANQPLQSCDVMFDWHPGGFSISSSEENMLLFIWRRFLISAIFLLKDIISLCRLRKDLKGLFVVHPAWYVRALITVIKPFIRWARMHFFTQQADLKPEWISINVWSLSFLFTVRSLAGRCASFTACRNWLSLFLWTSCKSQNASESKSTWSITAARAVIVGQGCK